MGGNVFGNTRRIKKDEYVKLTNDLLYEFHRYLLKNNLVDDNYYGIVKHYRDKKDFGDIDFISTVDKKHFIDFINQNINVSDSKFKVTSIKSTPDEVHFSIIYGDNPEPVQLDYIIVSKEDFEWAYNYYSFNDLHALIGNVAGFLDLSFGHKSLFKDIYTDKDGNVIDIPKNLLFRDKNSNDNVFYKDKIELTNNFKEALSLLDYPCDYIESKEQLKQHVAKFVDGFTDGKTVTAFSQYGMDKFKTVKDIIEFPMESDYFDKHLYVGKNHKSANRDKKRQNIQEAMEFYAKLDSLEKRDDISPKELEELEVRALRLRYFNQQENKLVLTPFSHYEKKLEEIKEKAKLKYFMDEKFSLFNLAQYVKHVPDAKNKMSNKELAKQELEFIKDFKRYLHGKMTMRLMDAQEFDQAISSLYDSWIDSLTDKSIEHNYEFVY